MQENDNIEDWYREELSNYNIEPDNDSWQSLSDDIDASTPLTDSNISEWYRKEAAKFEERPDYNVWDKIATKLDTSSVWDKLVISLGRYDQFIWWRNLLFKVSAVFLFILGIFTFYHQFSKKDTAELTNYDSLSNDKIIVSSSHEATNKSSTNTFQKITEKGIEVVNGSDLISSKSTNYISDRSYSLKKNIPNSSQVLSIKNNSSDKKNRNIVKKVSKNKTLKVRSLIAKDLNLASTNNDIILDFERRQLNERDISLLYNNGDFLVKRKNDKILFNNKKFSSLFIFGLYSRRIYAGVNTGIKKQGLISTINNDKKLAKYQQQNFLDFGNTVGVVFGFIASDKISVETAINFNSTSGYKRSFSNEGVSFNEDLNLRYSTVNFLVKRTTYKSTYDNKRYSLNMVAGVYGSFLNSSKSKINETVNDVYGYKKLDAGFILGIEHDRYLTKEFIITPGIRYNQGLLNTSNDNNIYSTSRNFSFELNLSIKYVFLRKS